MRLPPPRRYNDGRNDKAQGATVPATRASVPAVVGYPEVAIAGGSGMAKKTTGGIKRTNTHSKHEEKGKKLKTDKKLKRKKAKQGKEMLHFHQSNKQLMAKI